MNEFVDIEMKVEIATEMVCNDHDYWRWIQSAHVILTHR